MKRFLLFSLMQLFAFSMFAQTLESPLELPIGEVTVEGEATYFKYAAPEDKNVFLSITVSGWSTGISVSKDGTDETIVDGAQYNGSTYYPVNQGEEVIVFVSTWGDASTFNTAVVSHVTMLFKPPLSLSSSPLLGIGRITPLCPPTPPSPCPKVAAMVCSK